MHWRSKLLRPPQPRRWRQEEASDHPQGHPGISGEDDRHSDRELRRKMVCKRSAAQLPPPPAPTCTTLFTHLAIVCFQAAVALPTSGDGRTCGTDMWRVRREGIVNQFCFVVVQPIDCGCAQGVMVPPMLSKSLFAHFHTFRSGSLGNSKQSNTESS